MLYYKVYKIIEYILFTINNKLNEMKKSYIIGIAVVVIIAVAVLVLYKKGVFESFSGAFDPSTRLGLGNIGPTEDFCNVCK